MKPIFLVLALFPLLGFAQDAPPAALEPTTVIRFASIRVEHRTSVLVKNDAGQLRIGENCIWLSGPLTVDMEHKRRSSPGDSDRIITASHVSIGLDDGRIQLRGDKLRYDEDKKSLTLTGNITKGASGAERRIGEIVMLEREGNELKVVNIK